MMTKEFLRQITTKAFNGDEMSLLCGVLARKWTPPDNLVLDPENNVTTDETLAQSTAVTRRIWDIIEHVADVKAMYTGQAFGNPATAFPEKGETLESLMDYLNATHEHLEKCLTQIDEADLAKPVPTVCHGESAANLFWVLAQHDVWHGAQIKIIRNNLRKTSV